jgi:hypothetical protein
MANNPDTEARTYCPVSTLEQWIKVCDQALADIEIYKTTDYNTYLVIKDHIDLESAAPLTILIRTYGEDTASVDSTTMQGYKDRLYAICLQYPELSQRSASAPIINMFN